MTDTQKIARIKKLTADLQNIHRGYMEKFAALKKEQIALLKQVTARMEALKIGALVKDIKMKNKPS